MRLSPRGQSVTSNCACSSPLGPRQVTLTSPRAVPGPSFVGGAFPLGQKPFRHLDDARRLAVFLAAGLDSQRYPPERVCEDLRLLHSAGLSITLRQYPCRHELCPQMLRDLDRWVIEQITNYPQ